MEVFGVLPQNIFVYNHITPKWENFFFNSTESEKLEKPFKYEIVYWRTSYREIKIKNKTQNNQI